MHLISCLLIRKLPHSSLFGVPELEKIPSLLSAFFRAGQVIETFRGKGVYQLAVEEAISKLDGGQWV